MKTTIQRILTSLAAVLLTAICVSAFDFEADGHYYNIVPDGVELTAGRRHVGDITVPAKVTYNSVEYDVVGVGQRAFSRQFLTSVTFEGPIKYIGDEAFMECTDLTTVSHGGNIQTIGIKAFYETALTHFDFNDGLTKIGKAAFYKAKLTEVSLPTSLETIGAEAFYNCPFTSVTLPEDLKVIGARAFYGTKIMDLILPSAVKYVGEAAFAYCHELTNVVWDCKASSDGVMFARNEKLESVKITGDILILERGFLAGVKMRELYIGEKVKYLTNLTFLNSSVQDIYFMNPNPPEYKYVELQYLFGTYVYDIGEFYDVPSTILDCVNVHVPKGSTETYRCSKLMNYLPANVNFIEDMPEASIDGTVADNGTEITVADGRIIAEGVVEVYATDGRLVGRGLSDDLPTLTPGLYIVRTPSAAKKIIVR